MSLLLNFLIYFSIGVEGGQGLAVNKLEERKYECEGIITQVNLIVKVISNHGCRLYDLNE